MQLGLCIAGAAQLGMGISSAALCWECALLAQLYVGNAHFRHSSMLKKMASYLLIKMYLSKFKARVAYSCLDFQTLVLYVPES